MMKECVLEIAAEVDKYTLLTCKAIFKSITSQRHEIHILFDFVMLVNIQTKSTAGRQQLD